MKIIDLNKLAKLCQFHSERELAEIFDCGRSTIQRRLREIGIVKPYEERKKNIRKTAKRKFTPLVREILTDGRYVL